LAKNEGEAFQESSGKTPNGGLSCCKWLIIKAEDGASEGIRIRSGNFASLPANRRSST
jgi:hypothetical protein